jgi:hypothetical protein
MEAVARKGHRFFIMRSLVILILMSLASIPAMAQGNSGRTVTIDPVAALSFGTLAVSPHGGSIAINPDGSTMQAGAYQVGGVIAPAQFQIEVKNGKTYTIILPSSATLRSASGGALTLDSFTSDPNGVGTVEKPSDIGQLLIGARLNIPPGASGVYQGDYFVTVTLFE